MSGLNVRPSETDHLSDPQTRKLSIPGPAVNGLGMNLEQLCYLLGGQEAFCHDPHPKASSASQPNNTSIPRWSGNASIVKSKYTYPAVPFLIVWPPAGLT